MNSPVLPSEEAFIRSFQPGDEAAFRSLNEQWIRQYFELEAKDEKTFTDPQKVIVKPGGHIVFAVVEGRPVGCCALIRMTEGEFELSKLAVAPGHQGKGIGRRLLDAAIEKAKSINARRLYLETNHVLTPAIRLYESVGFRHLDPKEVIPSPYNRADVYMELRVISSEPEAPAGAVKCDDDANVFSGTDSRATA